MALGKRLINTGSVDAACSTDLVHVFGTNEAYSSNIATYKLNGDATDVSGDYDGVASNVTYAAGKFGNAAVFNGSSSRIDVSNVLSGFTNVYSFSIWAKIDNTDNFAFFDSNPTINVATNFLRFTLHQNGNYYFDFGNNSTARLTGTTPSGWRDGNWHHFVFVSTSTQKLVYVDGSLFNNLSSTVAISGKSSLTIGHYLTNYADGEYDQLRIYNSALSSNQVTALYNETASDNDNMNFLNETFPSSNIATYTMNGNSNDETGNFNGSDTNVTYATGQFGQAAVFNGSSSYINTNYTLTSSTTFTWSAWINTSNTKNTYVAGDFNSQGSNSSHRFSVRIYSQVLQASVNDSSGGLGTSISFGTFAHYGSWAHLVVTIDGTTVKGYVNGSQLGSTGTSSQSLVAGANPLTLGMYGSGGTGTTPFDGSIDQVRIFDKAISSEEVELLFNETTASTTDTNPLGDSSAVALYPLNYDASEVSGEFDGTPTNVDFGVGGAIGAYGARFNGSSSKIDFPNLGTDVSGSSTRTLSAWVNLDVNPSIYSAVFSCGTAANLQSFGLYITSTGTPRVSYYNLNYDTSTTLTLGNWHHIIAIYKGGNVEISTNTELYIDGQIQTITKTGSLTGLINTSNSNYSIGYYKATPANSYFDGKIDQVRIFSKAINPDEVAELYAETACAHVSTTDIVNYPTGTTPVAYYKLDNSSEDFSTGGNDGTDTNVEYRFGRYGQAAVFNNNSAVTTSFNIGRSNDFTISFWIKDITDSNFGSDNNKWIMGMYKNDYIPILYNKSSGKITYFVNDGTTLFGSLETPVLDDNWHHIVFTQDVNVETKLYVDGILQTSETISHTSMTQRRSVSYGTGLYFGQNPANSSTDIRFRGSLDQVRIYDTVLTDSQVTELYNEKPEVDTSNFKTVLYKGDGSSDYISNAGFQPDLVWVKNRGKATNHNLFDSIRGNKRLIITASAETSLIPFEPFGLPSFEKNGFYIGDNYNGDYGLNGNPSGQYGSSSGYVAWTWKGGGDAVSNTDGSITSQVSANTGAGFSIVKYTGNNSVSATVGHGLSDAEMIILKDLTTGTNHWRVWHKDLDANKWLYLSLNLAQVSASTDGGIRYIDSNTFGFINGTTQGVEGVNYTSSQYIAYCWHSVAGYSKMGSYTGDSSSTIPVTTNFRPSIVIIKNTDTASTRWLMYYRTGDSDSYYNYLFAEDSLAEQGSTSSTIKLAISDTGFTVPAASSTWVNNTNDNYIYMAFK